MNQVLLLILLLLFLVFFIYIQSCHMDNYCLCRRLLSCNCNNYCKCKKNSISEYEEL